MSNFDKMVQARIDKTGESWSTASRRVRAQAEPLAAAEQPASTVGAPAGGDGQLVAANVDGSRKGGPPDGVSLEAQAVQFLQARFPHAVVVQKPMPMHAGPSGPIIKTMLACVAIDNHTAVKQLLLCLPSLGSAGEVPSLGAQLSAIRKGLEDVAIGTGNAYDPHGNFVYSTDMAWGPMVVLFTDTLSMNADALRAAFAGHALVEVSDARSRAILGSLPRGKPSSLFISFGGPDEAIARKVNARLRERGVKTWFFPDDATPGQKLHRAMSEGVTSTTESFCSARRTR
jgi:hypothetical protein